MYVCHHPNSPKTSTARLLCPTYRPPVASVGSLNPSRTYVQVIRSPFDNCSAPTAILFAVHMVELESKYFLMPHIRKNIQHFRINRPLLPTSCIIPFFHHLSEVRERHHFSLPHVTQVMNETLTIPMLHLQLQN